jgi:AraC-like DNA-binding protein
VLPRPQVRTATEAPITQRLLVTDAGYFPHAAAHGRVRPHGAREAIVIVCADGAGRLEIGAARHPVRAGEALVIPARTPHTYVADAEDPWSIWWFHVAGSDVAELVEAIIGEGKGPVVPVRDMYAAVAAVDQIASALENDETTATLYSTAGVAWSMLARLAADQRRGEYGTSERIRLVQEHLRMHLDANTGVADLARLAGLSTSHFSMLFKAAMGTTVTEYVKRQRSARARELLLTTGLTVGEIARRVGYTDAFYFSRQFRAVNGTSPRDFRAQHRQGMI